LACVDASSVVRNDDSETSPPLFIAEGYPADILTDQSVTGDNIVPSKGDISESSYHGDSDICSHSNNMHSSETEQSVSKEEGRDLQKTFLTDREVMQYNQDNNESHPSYHSDSDVSSRDNDSGGILDTSRHSDTDDAGCQGDISDARESEFGDTSQAAKNEFELSSQRDIDVSESNYHGDSHIGCHDNSGMRSKVDSLEAEQSEMRQEDGDLDNDLQDDQAVIPQDDFRPGYHSDGDVSSHDNDNGGIVDTGLQSDADDAGCQGDISDARGSEIGDTSQAVKDASESSSQLDETEAFQHESVVDVEPPHVGCHGDGNTSFHSNDEFMTSQPVTSMTYVTSEHVDETEEVLDDGTVVRTRRTTTKLQVFAVKCCV